jgi:hypothetical protein
MKLVIVQRDGKLAELEFNKRDEPPATIIHEHIIYTHQGCIFPSGDAVYRRPKRSPLSLSHNPQSYPQL